MGSIMKGARLRPVFVYITIIASVAVIAMFFVSQHSRHVQIGYRLTLLQRERQSLRKRGRKLEFENNHATTHEVLAGTARKLGLALVPPAPAGDDN